MRKFRVSSLAAALFLGAGLAQTAWADTAALLEQAQQAWAAGELQQAQQRFEQALAEQPDSVEAHMRLAGFELSQQNYSRCIPLYQAAIGLQADNANAFIGLGMAYLHSGTSGAAQAAFNEALRLSPEKRADLEPILRRLSETETAAPNPHAAP